MPVLCRGETRTSRKVPSFCRCGQFIFTNFHVFRLFSFFAGVLNHYLRLSFAQVLSNHCLSPYLRFYGVRCQVSAGVVKLLSQALIHCFTPISSVVTFLKVFSIISQDLCLALPGCAWLCLSDNLPYLELCRLEAVALEGPLNREPACFDTRS